MLCGSEKRQWVQLCKGVALADGRATRTVKAFVGHVHALLAELVVRGALGLVTEHLIRLLHLRELLSCLWVIFVGIWVVLLR